MAGGRWAFLFSLGHSTIVLLGSVLIAWTALALQHRLDAVREIGGVIGTLVSALCSCSGSRPSTWWSCDRVYRTFVRVRAGERYVEEDLDLLLGGPRIARAAVAADVPMTHPQLAYVSAGSVVRAGI